MIVAPIEANALQVQGEGEIGDITWSHNGTRVAIGYSNSTIEILNAETSMLEHTIQTAHVSGMPVSQVAWSPTDDYLASGNLLGNITVWDTSSWLQIADLTEADDSISLLSWNRDGSRLVAFSYGYPPLAQWNTTNYDLIETSNDAGPMESIAWSPGRNQVISGIATGGFIVCKEGLKPLPLGRPF
jgi:WD40 repeat protein